MLKFVSIVGARPQFVKLAPLSRALADDYADTVRHQIVHTGQHYDHGMSEIFFDELKIPRPDVDLEVGSGSHGTQTGRMLEKLEQFFITERPDLVVVYGDTNSTLAGALAAVKLHIPVSHVEAGLRSFNRAMPEEINRIVADHTADQLLAPTRTAMSNLNDEHLGGKSINSGDIMYDAVLFNRELARESSDILNTCDLEPRGYGVVTIHRAENTDGEGLRELLELLNRVAADSLPLVFPMHPRTAARLHSDYGDWRAHDRLRLIEPVGYLDMIRLVDEARLVLTDSGGLQKEAFFLDCPCVTLRTETEWVETVQGGGNKVTGTDAGAVQAAVDEWLSLYGDEAPDFRTAAREHFGDGRSGPFTARTLHEFASQH